ncbi:hypothetical protein BK809_0000364 [Diplodia seriata]|uniref:FAD-binding domain-containing protein n=1 Tax=Diplodia seriata TaxID=420778 RepID=A0A1S8B9Z4_9PEZI|nr:hypothetical protein BK809_0000364 [Diplodia seriata]
MAPHNFEVLIAGSSISRMVLALILERLDIDFLVLETYPEIARQVGASIGFFPNGRILDQLGCYDDLRAKFQLGMMDIYFRSPWRGNTLWQGQCRESKTKSLTDGLRRHGYEPTSVDRLKPISGQGGNSAIESAAVLATELINALKALPDKTTPSDGQITTAFQRKQDCRRERLVQIVDAGHNHQSLMAVETPRLEFVATHIVPLGGMEGTFEGFATAVLPAERLSALPMSRRLHIQSHHRRRLRHSFNARQGDYDARPCPDPQRPARAAHRLHQHPLRRRHPYHHHATLRRRRPHQPQPGRPLCPVRLPPRRLLLHHPHLGPSNPTVPPTHHFDFVVT